MPNWITDFTHKIENQAAEAGLVYKIASGYYRDVIQKEAVLANITDKDHILCIGGGLCPFSAILFHQFTGAKVTVIDNNEICIPKAAQIVEKLGIGEDVRVFHKDGTSQDISFRDYSVVHLALQVSPMEQVFSSVKGRIVPGTRVLIRRPKRQLGGIYSQFADSALTCQPYTIHKSRNIGSTMLYVKPDRAK